MRRARRKPKDEHDDPMIREFETTDLGKAIEEGGGLVWIRRKPALPTSILLSPAIIEKLKAKGAKRGIGYQTMLKLIVHEHIDEY